MVALLKYCCCDYFTYRFSYDEILIPNFFSQSIIIEEIERRPVKISRVPFRYSPANSRYDYFVYLYENGVVLDFQNIHLGAMPFILKRYSESIPNTLSSRQPYSFFNSCLYFCPELVDNCVSADLELRSKIVDFISSIDISSFVVDEFYLDKAALLAHFETFAYKIHLKFSCDVIHTNKNFPSFSFLSFQEILDVKNAKFEVNII